MGHIELLDAYNNVINEWKERTENNLHNLQFLKSIQYT